MVYVKSMVYFSFNIKQKEVLNMVENLINKVIVQLNKSIPQEYIPVVQKVLSINLHEYELVPKTHELSCIRIPECLMFYLATKKIEGKSEKTLELYKLYLTEFVNMVQKPLDKLTSNDIRAYLYIVQENRKISNRTLDSRRTIVCSFLSWCAAEGYIPKNPAINITPIKYERKERTPLSDIQLETIRKSCKTLRESAMIELLYSSGCRVTELERLDITDIDFDKREVKLFGKGNKHRTSYLSARAVVALQTYLSNRTDNCPALFVTSRAPIRRIQKSGIESVIRKLGEQCGIPYLHPHLFRHTIATDCLRRGMDVTYLQKMLGHTSVETTMIYAKINDDSVKTSYNKYIG